MFNNKAVRSVLALLAMTGMAACSGAAGNNTPNAEVARSEGGNYNLSQPVQRASVTTTFVDTATAEDSALYGRLMSITAAEVTRMTETETMHVIDLRDAAGASVVKFNAAEDFSGATSVTEGIAGTAEVVLAEGVVTEMRAKIDNLDVIFAFGPEQIDNGGDQNQGQDQDQKQDTPKQDTPKQDTPKQDTPKQDTPKQDTPKQDTPKQDTPKQDSPKQDSPKQDSPKQDSPKQDSPKQDSPKQDSPKQDSPKQDSPKQDSPKQDSPKQDSPKQDSPKQDSPKQDSPKQDSPKQDSPKQDSKKN